MRETRPEGCNRDAIRRDSGGTAAFGPADWLQLAAAPTFAVMALLMAIRGDGMATMLCPAAHASLFDGMTMMYLLMGVFHSAPWLSAFTVALRDAAIMIRPRRDAHCHACKRARGVR